MLRLVLIGFLIAHGLVHVALWTPKYDPETAPFDPTRSWLLGDQRSLARLFAFVAAAFLVVAGVGLAVHGEWWRPTAVIGMSVSSALLLFYFNAWYLFILAVNAALIVGIASMDWPSKATLGA
jgi:hypothetical protein